MGAGDGEGDLSGDCLAGPADCSRCAELEESGVGEEVSAKTGLVLDPYFSATKVGWILDNVPGARARAERGELAFGTVDSWLIWHLTSGARHVTDVTNASRTLLFNIVKGEWDAELLRLFGVPASMLPEVVWCSEKVGEVTTTLGLGGVAIAGIAGDQQAALFGQLCWKAGEAKNTYGTGCFLLQNIGTEFVRSKHRLITTLAASAEKRLEYALEGSIFIGGAVVQWLRDNLRRLGPQRMWRRWRRRCRMRAGWCLCRRLWGWARRTGMRTRGDADWAAAGYFAGTYCAGGSGEHCVSSGGRVAGRGERDDASGCVARGWRRGGEQSADAVPGGCAGRAGGAAAGDGDDGAGSGLSGGAGDRVLGGAGGFAREAAGDVRFEPKMSADERAERRGRWSRAVERAKGWGG